MKSYAGAGLSSGMACAVVSVYINRYSNFKSLYRLKPSSQGHLSNESINGPIFSVYINRYSRINRLYKKKYSGQAIFTRRIHARIRDFQFIYTDNLNLSSYINRYKRFQL